MKINKRGFLFILVTSAIFLSAASHDAQLQPVPENMQKGYESIKAIDSYSYLEFIASDELEGRDTASKGFTIARNYIRSLFKTWGIKPAGDSRFGQQSFEQRISMVEKKLGKDTHMNIHTLSGNRMFKIGTDFSGGTEAVAPGVLKGDVVFAGYGIHAPDLGYDDFAGIDVRNKIVVISVGRPGGERKDSPFNQPENRARFAGRYTPAENCARRLAKSGALALLIVDENMGRMSNPGGYRQGARIRSAGRDVSSIKLAQVDPMVPFFWSSVEIAESIFSAENKSFVQVKDKIDTDLKPMSLDFPQVNMEIHLDLNRTSTVSANLLGKIEGSDPELKDEYIVIGAHLDHVGMNADGYVFNGADDNGSGSVGVMQAAKAFAMNPEKPKRSILFALWTGEEKGLVGSRYFIAFPTVPIKNVIACINLDMICHDTSLDSVKRGAEEFDLSEEHLAQIEDAPKKLLVAYTSLPSPELGEIYLDVNHKYIGLEIVPFNSFPMLGNSDHYPFALKRIPSVFFNTLGHRDLHQPTDTVEKINAEKMSQIVKLTYLLAFHIAELPQRLNWNSELE